MAEIVPSPWEQEDPTMRPPAIATVPAAGPECINGCGAIVSRERSMCRHCRVSTRDRGDRERVTVMRAQGLTPREIAEALGRPRRRRRRVR